jgi:hypothetical protein
MNLKSLVVIKSVIWSPGSTPLSIGCTSPIFFSRVRYLNPTSIGLPMSILMSRCKTSKWVRLTAVFKRLKFKQKERKKRSLVGAKPRSMEWYSSALPTTPLFITYNCIWFNGSKLILAVKMMKI